MHNPVLVFRSVVAVITSISSKINFITNDECFIFPSQVIVWGDYGRMDRKVFMGVVQVLLSDLNLSTMTFGWYKLFSTASMCEPPIFTPPTSPMVSPNQGFTRQTSSSSIHSLPATHRSRPPNMHKHSSLSQLGATQSSRGQPRVSRPRIEMIEDEGDYV